MHGMSPLICSPVQFWRSLSDSAMLASPKSCSVFADCIRICLRRPPSYSILLESGESAGSYVDTTDDRLVPADAPQRPHPQTLLPAPMEPPPAPSTGNVPPPPRECTWSGASSADFSFPLPLDLVIKPVQVHCRVTARGARPIRPCVHAGPCDGASAAGPFPQCTAGRSASKGAPAQRR